MVARVRHLAAACAVLGALFSTAVFAQMQVAQVDLPAQSLADAVKQLAEDTNTNLSFDKNIRALLESQQAQALRAEMTVDQAFTQLLAGSGLRHRFLNEHTVILSAGAAAANDSQQPTASDVRGESLRLAQSDSVFSAAAAQEQSADSADERKQSTIQEIIVTAQKRTQRLQDVGASITAISAEEIDRKNLVSMDDYLTFVPGVTMMDWGVGAPRIVMRGLGVATDTEQATVTTYLGEVPLTNPLSTFSADMKLVDIERVEVLRGPQGTLYGGGALGGAIRNIPVAPDLTAFGGKFDVGYSHTADSENDGGSLTGVINLPLIADKFGLRVAAYRFENAGYVDLISTPAIEATAANMGVAAQVEDDVGSQTYEGARATLLWRANDKLDASVMLLTQKLKENGRNDVLLTLGGYQATALRTADEYKAEDFDAANLVVNYDLPWGTLTSSTTVYEGESPSNFDQGRIVPRGSYVYLNVDKDSFVQEVRLASELSGPLQFLGGVYYEDFKTHSDTQIRWGGSPAALLTTFNTTNRNGIFNSFVTDTAKQKALFGELYYKPLQKIKLTAGGRWFDYDRDTLTANSGVLNGPSTAFNAAEDGAIFKGGIDFAPNENALIYAQYSQGFRLGRGTAQVNRAVCDVDNNGREDATGIPLGNGIQESDQTDNIELGGKFTLLDRRLVVNSAIYRIDWTDLPITVISTSPGCNVFANGGEARSQGAELEAGVRLAEQLQLNVSASYTDAEFTTNKLGTKGQRLPMSAKKNGSVGLQYDFDVSGHESYVRGDVSYIGEYSTGLGRPPSGDYSRLDMSAGVSLGQFNLEMYGRNLNNADELTTYFVNARGWRVVPRTVGVNLKYVF